MVVIETFKYLTGNSPLEIYFYKMDTSPLRASFIVDRGPYDPTTTTSDVHEKVVEK